MLNIAEPKEKMAFRHEADLTGYLLFLTANKLRSFPCLQHSPLALKLLLKAATKIATDIQLHLIKKLLYFPKQLAAAVFCRRHRYRKCKCS